MKKVLLSVLFALFTASAFAQISIEASISSQFCSVVSEPKDTVVFFDAIPPFSLNTPAVSVFYDFSKENDFHWLIGGDVGVSQWGPYISLDGGFVMPLFETEKINYQLRFVEKAGCAMIYTLGLFNHTSLEFMGIAKSNKGFYAGCGLDYNLVAYWGTIDYVDEKDAPYYKLVFKPGIDIFIGWKF